MNKNKAKSASDERITKYYVRITQCFSSLRRRFVQKIKAMKRLSYKLLLLSSLLFLFPCTAPVYSQESPKGIFIPHKQAQEDDYQNPDSRFNYKYKAESENFVVFWDKSFGLNPANYPDKKRRFNPDEFLKEGERFFAYYRDKLKFVDKKRSNLKKHKMILYMYNDAETTAYGWGADKVGMMWFRPCRILQYPYCPLAHEMAHSFQYMVEADGHKGYAGHSIIEYCAQWMLWQVYPDWTTIENYHLKSYMDKTHYALMHRTNMYHAPQMMEYWSNKHGLGIIGRMWRETKADEDPVSTYQRLTKISQKQFNDEVYDAATRFVTWDIPRIEKVCAQYANQHHSKLDAIGNSWYQIAASRCPQNYGYNAIRLNVPDEGEKISLDFKGIAGDKRFCTLHSDRAGWRYGFLAVKKNGKTKYGKMHIGKNGENEVISFNIPKDTEYLWLIVTGASTKHNKHLKEKKDEIYEQWPYQIRLSGTTPHKAVLNSPK